MLDYLDFPPTKKYSKNLVIIWLHGLGASGHDFSNLPELLLFPEFNVHYIFPHAPNRNVTINGGMLMPAWYDILDIKIDRKINISDFYKIDGEVVELMHDIQNKYNYQWKQFVLAGFSQGGAVAYYTGLNFKNRLGGIIATSTYLPAFQEWENNLTPSNKNLPIFIGHGSNDPVVPVSLGLDSKEKLIQNNFSNLTYKSYTDLEHSVSLPELKDINEWIIDKVKIE